MSQTKEVFHLSDWEDSKENIAPTTKARNPSTLTRIFGAQRGPQGAIRTLQPYGSLDSMASQEQALFESQLKEFTGLELSVLENRCEEYLAVWFRYIQWYEENHPTFTTTNPELLQLLERCTLSLKNFTQLYNHDQLIKIWNKYAEGVQDPEIVYKFLNQVGIGQYNSHFYVAYAEVEEARFNFEKASRILNKGLQMLAQPADLVRNALNRFQSRMAHRIQNMSEEERSEFDPADTRTPLQRLTRKQATSSVRPSTGKVLLQHTQSHLQSAAPHGSLAAPANSASGLGLPKKQIKTSSSNSQFSVFVDDEFQAPTSSTSISSRSTSSASISSRSTSSRSTSSTSTSQKLPSTAPRTVLSSTSSTSLQSIRQSTASTQPKDTGTTTITATARPSENTSASSTTTTTTTTQTANGTKKKVIVVKKIIVKKVPKGSAAAASSGESSLTAKPENSIGSAPTTASALSSSATPANVENSENAALTGAPRPTRTVLRSANGTTNSNVVQKNSVAPENADLPASNEALVQEPVSKNHTTNGGFGEWLNFPSATKMNKENLSVISDWSQPLKSKSKKQPISLKPQFEIYCDDED